MKLIIQPDRRVKLRLLDGDDSIREWILSNEKITLRGNNLEVMFDGAILELDQNRPERYLLLMLQYSNNKLFGSANAGNSDDLIYCVPSYIELTRTGNSESHQP